MKIMQYILPIYSFNVKQKYETNEIVSTSY